MEVFRLFGQYQMNSSVPLGLKTTEITMSCFLVFMAFIIYMYPARLFTVEIFFYSFVTCVFQF